MKLKVNGIAANFTAGTFNAAIQLKDYKNVIEAADSVTGEKSALLFTG